MKKTNLLIVIGLSLVIGGSALNITANFNNDKIETTQPKKANNTNYFELELSQKNEITNEVSVSNTTKVTTRKVEYQGYNMALMSNCEFINQTEFTTKTNQEATETKKYLNIYRNEINPNLNGLIKYEIIPYRSLKTSETKQTIITKLKLEDLNKNIIVNFKITALTSTSNWSNYMNQSNYFGINNNKNIINEITNPQNEQVYNETIEIKTIKLDEIENKEIEINTQIEILENTTTYHFILIEPYINNSSDSSYDQITISNPYVFMNIKGQNPPTITGYMIPDIENYEVLDIPGLLFNILTMPFAFISTAFNLTLFPGTPYQINLSNLFLTIMAILIFVFIVKLFINMKG